MALLKELNDRYFQLHVAKEDAFWTSKMDLKNAANCEYETKEIALKGFINDASWLPKIREELKRDDLSETERFALRGWERFFEVNSIESEEAKASFRRIIELEGELANKRRDLKLGYIDPDSGDFVEASSNQLRLMIMTDKDSRRRKAAFEGMRSLETFVLENGFLDIVKERNNFGRLLGYDDFYSWKVVANEGFTKERLFELLGDLEEKTRDACQKAVRNVADEHGEESLEPWNFEFTTGGDLTAEKDPYLRFETAVELWGRSFSTMGIRYRGAELTLDLVERKGKYENGFMHGPNPAYMENKTWHHARINFTANAVPGQAGSGQRALATLFHEGGHAAHFSNIVTPSPCFSMEFAPTSVAYAETQSMFLDSIVDDPDWLTRYALDEDGNPMPADLIKKIQKEGHTFRAHLMRKLMIVPFFEKALYELPETELTPENVLRIGREIEAKMVFQPADARPILSVPHLQDNESSAYYHAYVLALMAVYQTRAFFLKRDGFIMDNPNVGRDLANVYWNPGNSKDFLDLVEELTGTPFSADATVELVNMSLNDVYANADKAIERASKMGPAEDAIELDASVTMIHGDETIARTNGHTFEGMAQTYGDWIRSQENK